MAIFSTKEGDGMPDKKGRAPARDGVLSIIAADLKVVGTMSTEGVVKVDGLVEGNILAERQVLVSKGGEVKGDIQSNEVIIGGRIEGSVRATGRVEVQSTATVDGDILTKRILVHEGGEVNGNLRMGESDAPSGALRSVPGGDQKPSVVKTAKTTAG
jgi:cytoskeletal protein CcmA (bactofilin family)